MFELFLTFFKIGITTFGGGYAMIAIIKNELTRNKKWATEQEILDCVAISQCTPGVIAVNTATIIGHRKNGVLGAVVAVLGVILPSFLIISVLRPVMSYLSGLPYAEGILSGIRVAVAVIILNVTISFSKSSIKDVAGIIIAVVLFLALFIFKVSPVLIVIAASVAGFLRAVIKK